MFAFASPRLISIFGNHCFGRRWRACRTVPSKALLYRESAIEFMHPTKQACRLHNKKRAPTLVAEPWAKAFAAQGGPFTNAMSVGELASRSTGTRRLAFPWVSA